MKQLMFTIYDSKAQAYLQPFFMPNEALAKRAISDLISDPDHNFCKHVEDYTLYEIGTFDDQEGEITNNKAMQLISKLITINNPVDQDE